MRFPWGTGYRALGSTTPQEPKAIPIEIFVYGRRRNALLLSNDYHGQQSLPKQGAQSDSSYVEFARYLAASQ